MPYRDRMDIPHKFLELCKYQQDIIKQYQEYIEKHIHAKILEEDCSRKSALDLDKLVAKRITIPETNLVLLCEPWVIQEWNWLKTQTPLISPDYFINIAYKEQEERKNADSN
jgi:hypothetical protein